MALTKEYLFLQNKYKISALLLGPAENPHVEKYKAVLKQFPVSLQKHPWSDVEKDRLAKGIKQQYQETLIKDSLKNGRFVEFVDSFTNVAFSSSISGTKSHR